MPGYGPTVENLEAGKPLYKVVVPRKLPLGGKVQGNTKPGLFKVYIPTKDGGELTLKVTGGGSIEVTDPDGKPAKDATGNAVAKGAEVKFETPQNVVGWYGIVVQNAASYELSSSFVIQGHAKDSGNKPLVPWHFWYFPYSMVTDEGERHASAVFDRKFGTHANAWERTSFWKSSIEQSGADDGLLGHCTDQPACDAYNKKWGYTSGSESFMTPGIAGWWGHCDAASTAAALFMKPSGSYDNIMLQAWAATEATMRGFQLESLFHLGRGQSGFDPRQPRRNPSNKELAKPELGQAIDRDIGRLHDAVVQCIKKGDVALMDMRSYFQEDKDRSGQVWNQACYKFEATAVQEESDSEGTDEVETALGLKFKMKLVANADTDDAGYLGKDDSEGCVRVLEYVLHFTRSGEVDFENRSNNLMACTNGSGKVYFPPRYVLRILGLSGGTASSRGERGPGNPQVTVGDVKAVGMTMRPRFGG